MTSNFSTKSNITKDFKVMGFSKKNRPRLIRHAFYDLGISIDGLKSMGATDQEIKESL